MASPPPPRHFALLAAVFEGGLAIVAVAAGWLMGTDPLASLRWDAIGAAWGLAATLPMLGAVWLSLKSRFGPLRHLLRVVDDLLVPMFRGLPLIELAGISLLAGLGEEMLFRGLIQQAVADGFDTPQGAWVALVAASVLFGLAHRVTNTYAVLAGLIGFYLGGLWMLTDNLLVPIVAHAMYDFVVLVYLVHIRKPPESSAQQADHPNHGQDAQGPPDHPL